MSKTDKTKPSVTKTGKRKSKAVGCLCGGGKCHQPKRLAAPEPVKASIWQRILAFFKLD